ncbi:hypothetical protein ESCO_004789 [Escovopsis weberi]|uniref:Uncharacterized protein n=1 Tax=Escovopsis weberi TaxID=150374 RepID=A0A0M9VRH3_ESCWE|nr:hypothetical protein ESCO_004789 [Escovopsis weberi]
MAALPIPPPNLPALLAPILPALPSATVSTEPALAILPLLSPILRQRVRLFSSTTSTTTTAEPWLRLLCYDAAKAVRLTAVVRSGALEPHPVSGDVEVDWDRDSTLRFRRLDSETLQALALLNELDLAFRLVYCAGEDAWRVGELTVAEGAALSGFGGFASIAEAEAQFAAVRAPGAGSKINNTNINNSNGNSNSNSNNNEADDDDDDDDDGYWDRYDATPARTPAPLPSHASTSNPAPLINGNHTAADDDDDDDDDDYYAQYDQVQPALDNRDPDEEAAAAHLTRFDPPLGLARHQLPEQPQAPVPPALSPNDLSPSGWTTADLDPDTDPLAASAILQPRPDSSASSSGAVAVAHLEASAGKQAQSEFGVRQHIGRSVRNLWALARASGIERDEFEGIVRTELELLGLGDED